MRLVNSGSRFSIGLRALAFGAGIVAVGCGTNGQSSSGSSTPTSGTVCVGADGTVTSGTSGDVQLQICTDWTCEELAAQSEGSIKCTAPQPPGTSIPPGGYDCASDEGGLYCPPGAGQGGGGNGGWVCVANESMLTCTSGGSGGGGSGSGGSTGTGGSCVIGDESCGQTGEGGSGGSDGCIPGTEGCPTGTGGSKGSGGSSGTGGSGSCRPGDESCAETGEGGSTGSGGSGGCIPGTEGCPTGTGGSKGSGGSTGSGGGGESGSGGSGGSGSGGSGGSGGTGGHCTYTQGFWKTHPDAWPVNALTIGGVTYSEAQLLDIFNMDPSGDASLILAHQLIAAMLNLDNSSTSPAAVTQALGAAQVWMSTNKDADGRLPYGTGAGSGAANQATALATTLDNFNNGLAGVAHCN